MAKIKFKVVDETTIELAEYAKKGDILDLSEVNELDLSVLDNSLLKQIDKSAEDKAHAIVNKEKDQLANEFKLKLEVEKQKIGNDYAKSLQKAEKDQIELKNKIDQFEQQKQLAVIQATQKIQEKNQSEKDELQKQVQEQMNNVSRLQEKLSTQKETYEAHKKMLEEENARIKDFKEKQSTKMWGEDLEQFCSLRFEKDLRFAFPKAEFGKDNKVMESGKADFIFKDYTDNNNEYISIIFEMKNENPNSKNKQKNAEFYNKLEKNRADKNCKYSVLVSALEMENPLFEEGIYKVPGYENMFVIRPNFFTGIIKLLTTLEKNNRSLVDEYEEKKRLNIDYTNFENNLLNWQEDVKINIDRAKKKYDTAIDEINKTITHLTAVRDNLLLLNKNLTLMDEKSQNITVKKLTRNAPKVQEIIEDGKNKS